MATAVASLGVDAKESCRRQAGPSDAVVGSNRVLYCRVLGLTRLRRAIVAFPRGEGRGFIRSSLVFVRTDKDGGWAGWAIDPTKTSVIGAETKRLLALGKPVGARLDVLAVCLGDLEPADRPRDERVCNPAVLDAVRTHKGALVTAVRRCELFTGEGVPSESGGFFVAPRPRLRRYVLSCRVVAASARFRAIVAFPRGEGRGSVRSSLVFVRTDKDGGWAGWAIEESETVVIAAEAKRLLALGKPVGAQLEVLAVWPRDLGTADCPKDQRICNPAIVDAVRTHKGGIVTAVRRWKLFTGEGVPSESGGFFDDRWPTESPAPLSPAYKDGRVSSSRSVGEPISHIRLRRRVARVERIA